MALDGDAGIVADLLPGAGQRVEQRALAGIGVAGDRDQRERVHAASVDDFDRPGLGPADRDRHPADAHRQRIAAERAEVQRLDRDAFVEAELAQAAGLAFAERCPVDRRNPRARAQLQLVERR